MVLRVKERVLPGTVCWKGVIWWTRKLSISSLQAPLVPVRVDMQSSTRTQDTWIIDWAATTLCFMFWGDFCMWYMTETDEQDELSGELAYWWSPFRDWLQFKKKMAGVLEGHVGFSRSLHQVKRLCKIGLITLYMKFCQPSSRCARKT